MRLICLTLNSGIRYSEIQARLRKKEHREAIMPGTVSRRVRGLLQARQDSLWKRRYLFR